ncbi:MAG: hypothetical protein SGI88_21430 [Candidatus Hydrogenedentes bacterium]|nr:hypothetical protein [Candidatus Hydrogenedentota bacterium]
MSDDKRYGEFAGGGVKNALVTLDGAGNHCLRVELLFTESRAIPRATSIIFFRAWFTAR